MKLAPTYVALAVFLGSVSAFMGGSDDAPVLRAWLQWFPIQVDLIVLPDGALAMLLLAIAALTVQYLTVFVVAAALLSIGRRSVGPFLRGSAGSTN